MFAMVPDGLASRDQDPGSQEPSEGFDMVPEGAGLSEVSDSVPSRSHDRGMARGTRGGIEMAAVLEQPTSTPRRQTTVVVARDPNALADLVLRIVFLAGGRVKSWALEPAALVLVRAGILDGTGLTFGSDYDLSVRSREICRGFTRAVDSFRLSANLSEMWLSDSTAESLAAEIDEEAVERARELVDLPRTELERIGRHLLFAE